MDWGVLKLRATDSLRGDTLSVIPAKAGIYLICNGRLRPKRGPIPRATFLDLYVKLTCPRNLQCLRPSAVFLCKGSRFLASFGMTEVRLLFSAFESLTLAAEQAET